MTGIASLLAILLATYQSFTYVESAENVPRVGWLPDSASNVSYYKSYAFTAYEFDIPEADFVAWACRDLDPIRAPVKISRYSHATAPRDVVGPNTSHEALLAMMARRQATVTDGLYFEYRQRNGGGLRMAYDRNNRRAYVQTSPR
jgi:hypothetical protein